MKFRAGFDLDKTLITIEASKSDFKENDVCQVAVPFTLGGDEMAVNLLMAFRTIFELLGKSE